VVAVEGYVACCVEDGSAAGLSTSLYEGREGGGVLLKLLDADDVYSCDCVADSCGTSYGASSGVIVGRTVGSCCVLLVEFEQVQLRCCDG
jgi:hypothetical protein